MNRTDAEVKAKVKELNGWFDREHIRFPTVDACEQFKKWHRGVPASAASRAEYVERENERIRQQRESNMQATHQDIYGGDRA